MTSSGSKPAMTTGRSYSSAKYSYGCVPITVETCAGPTKPSSGTVPSARTSGDFEDVRDRRRRQHVVAEHAEVREPACGRLQDGDRRRRRGGLEADREEHDVAAGILARRCAPRRRWNTPSGRRRRAPSPSAATIRSTPARASCRRTSRGSGRAARPARSRCRCGRSGSTHTGQPGTVHHLHVRRQQVADAVARDGVRVAAAEFHQPIAAIRPHFAGDRRRRSAARACRRGTRRCISRRLRRQPGLARTARASARPPRGRAASARSRRARSRSRRAQRRRRARATRACGRRRRRSPPFRVQAARQRAREWRGTSASAPSAVSKRDEGLAEAQAPVVRRYGHRFQHRHAARRQRGAQAARQHRVEKAAAAARDGGDPFGPRRLRDPFGQSRDDRRVEQRGAERCVALVGEPREQRPEIQRAVVRRARTRPCRG